MRHTQAGRAHWRPSLAQLASVTCLLAATAVWAGPMTETEREAQAAARAWISGDLSKGGREVSDAPPNIRQLASRLAAVTDYPESERWPVLVVDDSDRPERNAFAYPGLSYGGGVIVVYQSRILSDAAKGAVLEAVLGGYRYRIPSEGGGKGHLHDAASSAGKLIGPRLHLIAPGPDDVVGGVIAHEMVHYLGPFAPHDPNLVLAQTRSAETAREERDEDARPLWEIKKLQAEATEMEERASDQLAMRLMAKAGLNPLGLVLATSGIGLLMPDDDVDKKGYAASRSDPLDHGTMRERLGWQLRALVELARQDLLRGALSDPEFLKCVEQREKVLRRQVRESAEGLGEMPDGSVIGDPILLTHSADRGAERADLVLVVDGTGSMCDDIEQVRTRTSELLGEVQETFSEPGALRTSLVVYRDRDSEGEDFLECFAWSDGIDQTLRSLGAISADGGGDEPEDVYAGLLCAINREPRDPGWGPEGDPWRDHVQKIVILMGDAPPKERPEGPDEDEVIRRAYEVDPAIVHTILCGPSADAEAAFARIAAATGGTARTIHDASELPDALLSAIGAEPPDFRPVPMGGGSAGAVMGVPVGPMIVTVALGGVAAMSLLALVAARRRRGARGRRLDVRVVVLCLAAVGLLFLITVLATRGH